MQIILCSLQENAFLLQYVEMRIYVLNLTLKEMEIFVFVVFDSSS